MHQILELHTAVPGRARLRVFGLRGRPDLKDTIEAELAARAGITGVSASNVTGTVLVLFEPGRDVGEIVGYVRVALAAPPRRKQPAPQPSLLSRLAGLFHRAQPPAPAPAPEVAPSPWHCLAAPRVLRMLGASERGLTQTEAAARLAAHGPNLLREPPRRSVLAHFLDQLQSLPVLLLAGSAVLSVATGGAADAAVIMVVVALNASIGCAMEVKAERTIQSLLTLAQPPALVLRDGAAVQIPAENVVSGDILLLRRGDPVPADARLLSAADLTVDESALTGESVPVEKSEDPVDAESLADRFSMVYRGTAATGGSGVAVVVATGPHTEIGKVQSLITESAQPETPLQAQMRIVGRQLVWATAAVAGAVFVIGLLRGIKALEMLKSAVSLAVAAVPEGLPTVATVALANSVAALQKRNVLVRRLQAVEALGAIDVLCFDKTGTLTLNRMEVAALAVGRRRYDPKHLPARAPISPLLEVCALCAEAEVDGPAVSGTPTETALLRLAVDTGIDIPALRRRFPLRTMLRRARGRNYMLTEHAAPDGGTRIAVKGNPAEVLALCRSEFPPRGRPRPLTEPRRKAILAENDRMAGEALRVLGVAEGPENRDLVWLGLAGLADPPREGLPALLGEFRQAGIRPVMITGDQALTATAVGQAVGLNGHGAELPDEGHAVPETDIFARVSPAQKLHIVRAFQSAGNTVAMTGDGINDGPALKAADVGVALGRSGTAVAREVADVVLTEDNIHAMLDAIREGRRVHRNIREAMRYVVSTNGSEVALMLAAVGFGLGQPLNPRQLLWINLMSDVFPELALALRSADPAAMRRPPVNAKEPVVNPREYAALATQTGIMTGSALAAYIYGLSRHGAGPAAGSMAFMTLTAAQLLHGITSHGPGARSNPYLVAGLGSGLLLLALAQFVPGVTALLGTARLSPADLAVCAVSAAASFLTNQAAVRGLPAPAPVPALP